MADFNSLLSTFREATGYDCEQQHRPEKPGSANASSYSPSGISAVNKNGSVGAVENDLEKSRQKRGGEQCRRPARVRPRPLKESIERMWRIALIRRGAGAGGGGGSGFVTTSSSSSSSSSYASRQTPLSAQVVKGDKKSKEDACRSDEEDDNNDNNDNKNSDGGKDEEQEEIRVHLAVCVVIVDYLPHEYVWRRWIETGDDDDHAAYDDEEASSSDHGHDNVEKNAKKECSSSSCSDDLRRRIGKRARRNKIVASAQLYIHAKHPEKIESRWVRSRTVSKSYRPAWNDVRIIRAMLLLAEEAIEDPKTTHILFCTESCIPITSLQRAARALVEVRGEEVDSGEKRMETSSSSATPGGDGVEVNMDRSFLSAYSGSSPRCSRFDERSCWSKLQRVIPHDAIWKALPGWCLLSRKHIQSILDMPQQSLDDEPLWPIFDDIWAPEEMYFATALSLLGHLPGADVVLQSVMHSKWPDRCMLKDPQDAAHPIVYDDCFGPRLVEEVRAEGYLFLRKIKRPVEVTFWENAVLSSSLLSSPRRIRTTQEGDCNYQRGKRRRMFDNYQNEQGCDIRNDYGKHYYGSRHRDDDCRRRHWDDGREERYGRSHGRRGW